MLLFPVAGDRSGQLVLSAATTVPFVSYSPFFCLTATPGSLCFQLATVLVQRKEQKHYWLETCAGRKGSCHSKHYHWTVK